MISKNNEKLSISQSGKIQNKHWMSPTPIGLRFSGATKATLDDHLLRVNGKLTELPIGSYSKPQIFRTKNATYITLTELVNHQVYLFDSSGTLLPNFPVYGTSEAALGDANRNGKVNLIVKGQDNEIILYQVN